MCVLFGKNGMETVKLNLKLPISVINKLSDMLLKNGYDLINYVQDGE